MNSQCIVLGAALLGYLSTVSSPAGPLGDFDGDGKPTILDVARMHSHLSGVNLFSAATLPTADVNQDGSVNASDIAALREAILNDESLPESPWPELVNSSPSNGEAGVAITRETILRFSEPLAGGADLNAAVSAEFGGKSINIRANLSADRRTLTVFYPNLLPSGSRVRLSVDSTALQGGAPFAPDVSGNGEPGGTAIIDFDTLGLTVLDGTSVSGRVFASEPRSTAEGIEFVNVPLTGVTITVDGREDSLSAITDDMGNFSLSPSPVGRFFVHIDGRTASNGIPQGAYYPFVGKAWEASPGKDNNIGDVYLPLVRPETLQSVSIAQDTTITFPDDVMTDFPEFEGVAVTVPANALFSDNGTRGGMVGIAPVSPDRLPGTLPEGLDFPLVITVQTDGATNFDVPAPLCFPNLPDPETGVRLPAGAKSALWSFNHDTGRFEISGAMTVSSDGNLICTDPGVGVLAPGWHGTQPGCELRGRKPNAPTRLRCPSASAYEVGKLLASTAGNGAKCLVNLADLGDKIACAVNVITATGDMFFIMVEVEDRIAMNGETLTGIKQGMTGIKAGKGLVGAVSGCLANDFNPLTEIADKIVAGMQCMQSLVNTADGFCALYDRGATSPAHCRPGYFAQLLCRKIKEIKLIYDAQLIEINFYLTQFKKGFATALACAGVDGLDLLVNGFPPAEGQLARDGEDRDLTPEEIAAYLAQSRISTDALAAILSNKEPLDAMIRMSERLERDVQELTNLAALAVEEAAQPVSRSVYYVVSTNGTAQRGTTDASGTFRRNAAADTDYFFAQWDAATNSYGEVSGRTGANGAVTELPPLSLNDASGLTDTDGDGLADVVEFVLGTDPENRDSDNDGVNDFAEGSQGTNPLDNVPNGAGLIASADTPGTATDVAAFDDMVAVADGDAGVTIFNVFNGMNPTIVAQVETSGNASAVALSARYAAVADGSQGLAIIDLIDPPAARVTHQVMLGANAISVELLGGTCFVGLTSGDLVAVDLESGTVLEAANFGASVHDIRGVGDQLYLLTASQFFILNLDDLTILGSVESGGTANSNIGRKRLFVGTDGVAYVTHRRGYDTFDISSSLTPQLTTATVAPQFGWKQIVTNGSGTGIAASSPNQAFDGPHNISTYNVSDPSQTQAFLAEIVTPGVARAISLYNGIAYVADHRAGLQAVRYLEPDRGTVAPTIALSTNFAENRAEEGQWMRVSTAVTDDIEVRNVQLFVNDTRVATDGNYPFEFRVLTPLITDGAGTIDIRARATDTAGNSTDSQTLTLTLVPDATPPRTTRITPEDGAFRGGADSVIIGFSEAIAPGSVNSGTIRVTNAGPDQVFGTGDDSLVGSGSLSLQPNGQTAILRFDPTLADALYRLSVDGVTDLAGNPLAAFTSTFEIGELTMVAAEGTPADRFQPSANAGQRVTIAGSGFAANDRVTFPTRDQFGAKRSVDVAVENVTANGRRAEVIVPLNACTGLITLPDGSPLRLQVVPTITSIDGGQGRSTAIYGTGFIEGATTARFGPGTAVVDRGTASNDGIDVRNWNSQNDRLDVSIPAGAQLPYQIITEGGSSGRATDVSMVIATASTGTPADENEASANIDQIVQLRGADFVEGETKVTLEAINQFGTAFIITIDPDSITADGTTLQFTVPKAARTGIASVLNGGSGFPLQVVPTITSISGGRGRSTSIYGGGFVEGATTVRFGSDSVLVNDSGVASNDGIDVRDWSSNNDRLDVSVPAEASLPYEVITEGGSSGKITNVTGVIATAPTGTPAISSEASAVVGQSVELLGSGFAADVTMITLEAMDQFGTPYITTVAPESVANDGTSLSFIVPDEARTGVAVILNGAGGKLLQIVPTVSAISGGRGRFTSIYGTGFTEGNTTVRFGSNDVTVTDGGIASNDGIDIRDWSSKNDRLEVTVPEGANLPYEIITEGGSSGKVTDVTDVFASSTTGTPAVATEASAVVGQSVELRGNGFSSGVTKVTLEAMDQFGSPYITTIDPAIVSNDGTSLSFTVPAEARTGVAVILNGSGGNLLQIVPTISSINGGRGRLTSIYGTGFIEGHTTVRFGSDAVSIIDGGVASNDGIDVRNWSSLNDRLDVNAPENANLPYEIITEGGSSGRVADVTNVVATANSGTAANNGVASANVGQIVEFRGSGFLTDITRITLEAMDQFGTPFIKTIDPISISNNGTILTFEVPAEARTGTAVVLNGGGGKRLQIVPTITSAAGNITSASFVSIYGSGFTEGFTTVNFDGSLASDGIDVRNWSSSNDRIDVTVPAGGSAPVRVTNEGGTSASFTP